MALFQKDGSHTKHSTGLLYTTKSFFYTPLQFLLKVHAHSGNTTLNSLKRRVRMLKAVRFSFAMIKYLIRPFASHAPEYYTDHHLWQND